MALYTYTPKAFAAGSALTGAAATYYTAPSAAINVCSIIKELQLCNTDNSARTVTVYAVPAAGSPAVANTLMTTLSLQPYETQIYSMSKVLAPGATIQALASSAGVVSMSVSGIEVTT